MSNLQRHKDCTMRSEIGNCLAIGGFCTSVSKEICEALQNAYTKGKHSVEVSEGEWIERIGGISKELFYQCSKCYGEVDTNEFDYCPWCGARMKGGDDEKSMQGM